MKRRNFIKTSCLGCLGAAVLGALLQGCSPFHLVTADIENNRVSLKKSEFIVLKKEKKAWRKWVLVKTERLPFPLGVYRFDEGRYAASYLECTHQQCEIAPEGDYLQCPCHGSEFSNEGKLQKGPAGTDLKTFRITADAHNIYIHLL
ncbi:MAG: Rieske (2Fe-2S) protein [Lewinellaceae bacterium]|nr:Rieske (2Fe-2S) protein [Lewinellaceae bacterium]